MGTGTSSSLNNAVAAHQLDECDRTRSAEARRALRKLVWEPLKAHGVKLRPPCPLCEEVDILSKQEEAKKRLGREVWECQLCGKLFSSEHHVDMHQARRHSHERYSNGTLCLADLCDIYVPCIPYLMHDNKSSVKPLVSSNLLQSNTSEPFGLVEHERPAFCEDAQAREKELTSRRNTCGRVLDDCLRMVVDVHNEHALFYRHLDRLKTELCERASFIACTKRKDVHSVLHPHHLQLRTTAQFPYIYFSVCAVLILALLSSLYCFCPTDIHTVEQWRTRKYKQGRRRPRNRHKLENTRGTRRRDVNDNLAYQR